MDGPIRLGQRKLAVEFQTDRHGADRLELAYRRLEKLASTDSDRKSSVQVCCRTRPAIASVSLEIHG